jgi:hypothetical protein
MINNILKDFPLVSNLLKEWFMVKLINSFENNQSIDENFKKSLLEKGVQEEELSMILISNPRSVFDFLDKNSFYVTIAVLIDTEISYEAMVNNKSCGNSMTRLSADFLAVSESFRQFEKKIKDETTRIQ